LNEAADRVENKTEFPDREHESGHGIAEEVSARDHDLHITFRQDPLVKVAR
jgi:hypothetical protein